ncbi:Na+/H+ antiporter [Reyranella sp.]|uniref:Na+/H+ antiporter n=1 Tax=Reyranella sp. TaxID=1929291 RepID=UPI003BA965E0
MAPLEVVLILLTAVVLSGVTARSLPLPIPLPLVQIAFGAFIAAVADLGVQLDPQLFFVLFLPPLLFYDAWRLPKAALLRDKGTIAALALGLVVFTVLGLGFLIHWMIPQVPLAVAFALAAVISPTDPVAVQAIAARTRVPPRFLRILEGEALLNDASGLVCMRFALAALLTGTFSLPDAFVTFLWVAAGGLAIGAAVTLTAGFAKDWVSRRYGEDTGAQILISLLIPFAAYRLAEMAACSGILAAVAAGIAMSLLEQRGGILAVTRVRRSAVWETVQFGASGIIFILLGEQLPRIASGAARVVRETGHDEIAWLAVYVVAINVAVMALRFVWVAALLKLALRRPGMGAGTGTGMGTGTGDRTVPGWRPIAAMSVAGARGTVTLAGVLALPFFLADGRPFPARDLAIFLAAGVIIASLVAAFLLLPRLLRRMPFPPEPGEEEAEDEARLAASHAALAAIRRLQHDAANHARDADPYADAAERVAGIYRQRIESLSRKGPERDLGRKIRGFEATLRLAATQAERQQIYRLVRMGRLSEETGRRLVREVDLVETRLKGS